MKTCCMSSTRHCKWPCRTGSRTETRFPGRDIFAEQPGKDADVCYFRSFIFEWRGDEVLEVSDALKPALKECAIVLIQDAFVPDPGVVSRFLERKLRLMDLLVLALENHSTTRSAGVAEFVC